MAIYVKVAERNVDIKVFEQFYEGLLHFQHGDPSKGYRLMAKALADQGVVDDFDNYRIHIRYTEY